MAMLKWCLLIFFSCANLIRANEDIAEKSCDTTPLRIAYLVLVHNKDTLEGSMRLIDALYHDDHTFYVHFDTKMKSSEYEYEWNLMSYQRNNMRKFSAFDLKWGSWQMLAPWFATAKKLISAETREWDIFINLSGDSYPVLKPEPLRKQLLVNGRDLNYMTCSSGITGMRPTAWSEFDSGWHKRKAFPFPIVKGEKFTQTEAYYGSQWMILSREFVEFVMSEIKIPGTLTNLLADWFENGSLEVDTGRKKMWVKPHIPDEIFFPTVLMNSEKFNGSFVPTGSSDPLPSTIPNYRLPHMRDMTYIRMDEHYPWSSFNQRYESPSKESRSWGPYYLGTYDLGNIRKSGALFIRKVSSKADENVLRILPVNKHSDIPNIGWPKQLLPLHMLEKDDDDDQTLQTSGQTSGQQQDEEEDEDCGPDGDECAPAPAPAPGPSLPGINILHKGAASPVVDAKGCVAVAESIHCPPGHNIDNELALKYDLPVGIGFGG